MSFRVGCGRCQRELARLAVLGREPEADSRQARHVAVCVECGQAWQELRGVACQLSRLPDAPVLSPAFDTALMARVRAAGAERAAARPAFGTGAWVLSMGVTAALMVCAFLPHNTSTGLKPRPETQNPPARVQAAVVRENSPRRRASHFSAGFQPRRDNLRHFARLSPPRHSRHFHKTRLLARAESGTRPVHSSFIPHPSSFVLVRQATWRESGAVYEASGDYVSAAQAYRQANAQSPDTETILAAAVNAERAEDRGQALESYALLLAQNTDAATNKAANVTASPDTTDEKPIEEHNHNEANKQP